MLGARSLCRSGRPARVHGTLWDDGVHPDLILGEAGGPAVAGLVLEVSGQDLARLDVHHGVGHDWRTYSVARQQDDRRLGRSTQTDRPLYLYPSP